jgi:conjugative relaxase-like TrwC/TraI family protein
LYYTNDGVRDAKPRSRDDYYLSEGSGLWWSSGGTVVRHGAPVETASFRALCAGHHPGTGRPLVRAAGARHWAGQDITLTPGKSVSVLWSAGTSDRRAAIEAAHRAAVEQAVQFIVDEGLISVRTGAGGAARHRPADLIIAMFNHYTTREGDPNIHTHCVALNVAGAPLHLEPSRYKSQTHLTIEVEQIYAHQRTIGAVYRSTLAEELRRRFEFCYREAGRGQWEVLGIPEMVLTAFSKRSTAIRARVGTEATSAQREVAALATRRGKDTLTTGAELEARWQAELAASGVDVWRAVERSRSAPTPAIEAMRDTERDGPSDPPEVPGGGPVAHAASELFRHESVLARMALLQRALEFAGLRGLGVEAVVAELAQLEEAGALLPLAPAELGPGTACWTTPGIAACEAALLRAADRPEERAWIGLEAVEAALVQFSHLSPEQAAAVRHASGPDGVSLLEAGAGTGKTTTVAVLVAAARASGMRVEGLAPSWVAADELARSAGIPTRAIARWRQDQAMQLSMARAHSAEPVTSLDRDTLLMVDEAGMTATRDLEAVLTAARAAGAKVVLVGDRRQLAPVGGGSALRAVAEVVGRAAMLCEVRRQSVDWQRAASVAMARGDSEAGLRGYVARGGVELVSGAEAAQARAVALWSELRAAHGQDSLIVTRRNADATALNALARTALQAEGRLGPDQVAPTVRDREDRSAPLTLAVGDCLRFGEGLPHLGVRNGDRARVAGIVADAEGGIGLQLELDDGRVLDEPWARLARAPRFGREQRTPKLAHAYAGTAHSAQGRTVGSAVLYLARSTDARELYVGLTRHRHAAGVVVERDRLEALCRLRQADTRAPATDSQILEKLYQEARSYRDKANVVDYATCRIDFVQDGRLALGERAAGIDVRRAIRAVRALREASVWLGLERMVIPGWRTIEAYGQRMARPLREQTNELLSRVGAHLTRPARPIERPRDYHYER